MSDLLFEAPAIPTVPVNGEDKASYLHIAVAWIAVHRLGQLANHLGGAKG